MLSMAALDSAIATFKASMANGDGVIPVGAVDAKFAPLAEAMIAVTGGADACDGS